MPWRFCMAQPRGLAHGGRACPSVIAWHSPRVVQPVLCTAAGSCPGVLCGCQCCARRGSCPGGEAPASDAVAGVARGNCAQASVHDRAPVFSDLFDWLPQPLCSILEQHRACLPTSYMLAWAVLRRICMAQPLFLTASRMLSRVAQLRQFGSRHCYRDNDNPGISLHTFLLGTTRCDRVVIDLE